MRTAVPEGAQGASGGGDAYSLQLYQLAALQRSLHGFHYRCHGVNILYLTVGHGAALVRLGLHVDELVAVLGLFCEHSNYGTGADIQREYHVTLLLFSAPGGGLFRCCLCCGLCRGAWFFLFHYVVLIVTVPSVFQP